MDPVSQGAIGAAAALALARKLPTDRKSIQTLAWVGSLSGMAPDLDVFIRSSNDPLLALEYHRHFTHALSFIPFGAAICALVFWLLLKKKFEFKLIYLISFLGFATHGLLDACTTYGTQLFQPFSNQRISWDVISIVDPLYTLPLLLGIITTVIRSNLKWVRLAFAWSLFYLALGWFQSHRAETLAHDLARSRGLPPISVSAKPSFANLIVFKVITETEDQYWVDAIRVGITTRIYEGTRVNKLDLQRDFPSLQTDSILARDIERFRWFSEGYLSVHPTQPDVIADMRYSLVPNSVEPMWGIKVDLNQPDRHVPFVSTREADTQRGRALWAMILGKDSL